MKSIKYVTTNTNDWYDNFRNKFTENKNYILDTCIMYLEQNQNYWSVNLQEYDLEVKMYNNIVEKENLQLEKKKPLYSRIKSVLSQEFEICLHFIEDFKKSLAEYFYVSQTSNYDYDVDDYLFSKEEWLFLKNEIKNKGYTQDNLKNIGVFFMIASTFFEEDIFSLTYDFSVCLEEVDRGGFVSISLGEELNKELEIIYEEEDYLSSDYYDEELSELTEWRGLKFSYPNYLK